nr:hypothetical protein [Sphingomonas sp.]
MQAFLEELSEDEMRIIRCAPHPARWSAFAAAHGLNWNIVPFRAGGANAVPAEPGFYCFIVANTAAQLPLVLYPIYAGETGNLRQRYGNYLTDRNSARARRHVRKFLNVFWGEIAFAYATMDIAPPARLVIEKELNDALMPPYSLKDFSAEVKAKRGAWQ